MLTEGPTLLMQRPSQWPSGRVPEHPLLVPAVLSDKYKTELCRNWMQGGCRYGDKCQFAHGVGDLRARRMPAQYKTRVCRTFSQTGSCPYGSKCRFIHSDQPTAEQLNAQGMGTPEAGCIDLDSSGFGSWPATFRVSPSLPSHLPPPDAPPSAQGDAVTMCRSWPSPAITATSELAPSGAESSTTIMPLPPPLPLAPPPPLPPSYNGPAHSLQQVEKHLPQAQLPAVPAPVCPPLPFSASPNTSSSLAPLTASMRAQHLQPQHLRQPPLPSAPPPLPQQPPPPPPSQSMKVLDPLSAMGLRLAPLSAPEQSAYVAQLLGEDVSSICSPKARMVPRVSPHPLSDDIDLVEDSLARELATLLAG